MSAIYASAGEATARRRIGEPAKGERPDIPERLLWQLWKRRASRQAEFRTGSGSRIRVLYPGRQGTSAGPDFRDALLDVEGVGLVRGDVEIHRRQRDWDSHGHGDDPNYNGVVVHGVLDVDAPETDLQSGTTAPVVSLSGLLDEPGNAGAGGADDNPATGELWGAAFSQGLQASRQCGGGGRPAGPGGRRAFPEQGDRAGPVRIGTGTGAGALRGPDGRSWLQA